MTSPPPCMRRHSTWPASFASGRACPFIATSLGSGSGPRSRGAADLTALALELGFSSHGHFSDTFRREFGRTPSEVRRESNPRGLRQLSKDLEA
ncbi:helix-turn-helix domain-containing protein [Singulisphaera sp. PoT]|uniref:helix-turn-helix domain-containing protein n=1 Tax=Singulisphaera sp. PoT TaxID=3411797 RepID=UPI003BF49BAE